MYQVELPQKVLNFIFMGVLLYVQLIDLHTSLLVRLTTCYVSTHGLEGAT